MDLFFENDIEGFNSFNQFAKHVEKENNKTGILIDFKPTWHCWFAKKVPDELC